MGRCGGDGAPIQVVSSGASLDSARALHRFILSRLMEGRARGVSWHLESSLSASSILAALLGFWVPRGAAEGVRRRVILSKGHASLALYAAFEGIGLLRRGSLEEGFALPWSPLQAHPEATRLPEVPVSTGSLGQGLSVAAGMVLAARIAKRRLEVAVVLGDGELDEGQVWEAAATIASKGLHEVVALIDRNRMQHTGPTEDVKSKEPLADRWRSFGWNVVTVPGSVDAIIAALKLRTRDKPLAIIVETREALEEA